MEAWLAWWVAEETVSLSAGRAGMEWDASASAVGFLAASCAKVLHATLAVGPTDWTDTFVAGFAWWVAEEAVFLQTSWAGVEWETKSGAVAVFPAELGAC